MKKSMVLSGLTVLVLVFAVFLGACVPPLEQGQSSEAEIIPYDYYIIVKNTASTSTSRSLTSTQTTGAINYYELIALEYTGSVTQANVVDPALATSYSSDRKSKGEGSLVVPVKLGKYYAVLLLEGYRSPDGGNKVLLNASYGTTTNAIKPGANTVDLSTITNSMRLDLTSTTNIDMDIKAGGVDRPTKDLSNGSLLNYTFPLGDDSTALTTSNPPSITLKGNFVALYTAAVNAYTSVTSVFTGATMNLDNYSNNAKFIDKPWSKPLAETWAAGGDFIMKAGIPITDMPTTDGDAKLYYNAYYCGFGVTEAIMTSNSWPKEKWFTKWTFRNGLTDGLDIPNNTGGAIFATIGNGSGDPIIIH